MTKAIRIENADTSDWKVVVQVWDKGYPEGEPDKLVREIALDYPTAMAGGDGSVYLTSTRYLVVKEKSTENMPNPTDYTNRPKE